MRLLKLLKVCFCCLTLLWLFPRKVMSWMKHLDSDSDDDDWGCEYDSTWEDQVKTCKKKKPFTRSHRDMYAARNMYAARDMQEFRHSCRNLDDSGPRMSVKSTSSQGYNSQTHYPDHFYNLKFYIGLRKSEPDDVSIHEFHRKWKGQYDWLERVHSYIQWLFPIQEQGMNWQARVLTKEEIMHFRKDKEAKDNLLKSYELMLDFYGIRLVNNGTGDVERAPNWKERFDNLNRNTHNNLRITRILKCLGTLGFEHFQEKLVMFFLEETLVKNRLSNVKQSVLDYFIFAVLDKSQRKKLITFAFWNFEPKQDFVWGPKKILLRTAMYENASNETKIVPGYEHTAFGERGGTPSRCSNTEGNTRKITNDQKFESSQSIHAKHEETDKCQKIKGKKPGVSSDQTTSNESKEKEQVKGEDHIVSSKSNTEGNTREITNEPKIESSQSIHAKHEETDKCQKMKDKKPGVSSDQTTSNKSKEKGQVKGEDHHVSSKSPQGKENNGFGWHVKNQHQSKV